jgi:hypothetical protein
VQARRGSSRKPLLLLLLGAGLGATVLAVAMGYHLLPSDAALTTPTPTAPKPAITGLRVQGNQIVNGDGQAIRLLGFNHAGAEYACIEGWGIFDAPGHTRLGHTRLKDSVIQGMKHWSGANTVRLPLNEQCWLGLGVKEAYGGANYQRAIQDLVTRLHDNGFVVVLDLHRSAPGDGKSTQQEQMPDRDHSVEFWRQVAASYKDDSSVVFDLFNEPAPFGVYDSADAWRCWRDGGCRLVSRNTGEPYVAAGMNELIQAIRDAGATNVVFAGGIHWARVLTHWLEYKLNDPLNNLGASFHAYQGKPCSSPTCYDRDLGWVVGQVPLFVGEVGSDTPLDADCKLSAVGDTGFSKATFDWLDARGGSYTAWSWNLWKDCWSLIARFDGTPTPRWGQAVKARLASNLQQVPATEPSP